MIRFLQFRFLPVSPDLALLVLPCLVRGAAADAARLGQARQLRRTLAALRRSLRHRLARQPGPGDLRGGLLLGAPRDRLRHPLRGAWPARSSVATAFFHAHGARFTGQGSGELRSSTPAPSSSCSSPAATAFWWYGKTSGALPERSFGQGNTNPRAAPTSRGSGDPACARTSLPFIESLADGCTTACKHSPPLAARRACDSGLCQAIT